MHIIAISSPKQLVYILWLLQKFSGFSVFGLLGNKSIIYTDNLLQNNKYKHEIKTTQVKARFLTRIHGNKG